jgi:hypothetical protein
VAESTTTPLDRLVDLLVYAPVGLALTLKDDLGSIIERGRRTVVPQVQVARFMGRIAVAQVTRASRDLLDEAIGRVTSAVPVAHGPAEGAADARPAAPPPSDNGDSTDALLGTAPDEEQLAIPGYDSLSAAHVVQRLAGLGDAELDAVRRYEEAHRGRRTILCKIDQLQAGHT